MPYNTALTAETRYLYGETNPVDAFVNTGQDIKVGDFVYLDISGDIRNVNLATTVASIAASFAGISGQTKAAGVAQIRGNSVANQIRIDTDGFFEVPCSEALTQGDLVGLKLAGGKVAPQEVAKAADSTTAVGVCVKTKTANETHVLMRLVSKKFGILAAK